MYQFENKFHFSSLLLKFFFDCVSNTARKRIMLFSNKTGSTFYEAAIYVRAGGEQVRSQ